jgi:predicted DNA-binding protein
MPVKKIYDETPLQVLTDKPTRARVRRLSEVTGMSQAAVVRSILEIGVPLMEDMWKIEGEVEVPDADE